LTSTLTQNADINPAGGEPRVVWANPNDILPEEEEPPRPLLDLVASAAHPLAFVWKVGRVALAAFGSSPGHLPWLDVSRLVLSGLPLALWMFGLGRFPWGARRMLRCAQAVGRLWWLCDAVTGGKRPTLLQLAAPLVDLPFQLRWELHLFRQRRERG
jgi:hypothetical protein